MNTLEGGNETRDRSGDIINNFNKLKTGILNSVKSLDPQENDSFIDNGIGYTYFSESLKNNVGISNNDGTFRITIMREVRDNEYIEFASSDLSNQAIIHKKPHKNVQFLFPSDGVTNIEYSDGELDKYGIPNFVNEINEELEIMKNEAHDHGAYLGDGNGDDIIKLTTRL